MLAKNTCETAVCYLVRGMDDRWKDALHKFLASYKRFPPGMAHNLYVIFKGFPNEDELSFAKAAFETVEYTQISSADDQFDIGAYREAALKITERKICFLNGNSELLSERWLSKLAANLALPGVGIVGATGSYESLRDIAPQFPRFPNIHVRSNAFMTERELFCTISQNWTFKEKLDAYRFESGDRSLTRQILARGLRALVVGRNCRGYSPRWWPKSGTFRQGSQDNLLVADNQTREFASLRWFDKSAVATKTWGAYLQEGKSLSYSRRIPKGLLHLVRSS